jgi:arabinogalactan oligomer/maltooligosaccharide transport system permease protein
VTALIVPVLGAVTFTIIPLVFMILVAFTNYSGNTAYADNIIPAPNLGKYLSWVNFNTFKRLFGESENLKAMLTVFSWTMIWAILATFTCYFGGLFLAMLLNKKCIKGKIIYRSLLVISMALPQFVSLLVMKRMFADNGLINQWLKSWGYISWLQNQGWISSQDNFIPFWETPWRAKTLIILINMWVGIPYYMLLMSGLLINIPQDYYEAAKIEGASRSQVFHKITLPYILYMTTPCLITSFVSNINNFNVIWFLTGSKDGKADETDILITWLYKITMGSNLHDYNFGAAIGIVMFIISASVSLIVYQRSASYKNEEEFR